MKTKALALFSFLSILPAGIAVGQPTPPVHDPNNPPTGIKTCGVPNDPSPNCLPGGPCGEDDPDGNSDSSDDLLPMEMPRLGPSPHSGSTSPACELETPDSVIGLNHGGALLKTTDLKVPGSLSGIPLQFSRHYNSRDAEGFGELMGHGRTWTHSFSWRMTVQGNVARVDFPSGRRLEYTQAGTTTYRGQAATIYAPPAGNGERIYKTGDFWHVDQVGAAAHTFERVVLPDSTVLYYPRESVDTRGNKLTYQTNAAARITKASDTLGNHIELTYSQVTLNRKAAVNLHTITAAPVVGWNEITLSGGQPFRWVQGVSAPNFYFECSEVEFYKSNGSGGHTKLSGTAYGTGPARNNGPNTFDKAFDGSTSTRFSFCRPNHGIAGLDLGTSGAATVTKIRYHVPSAFSAQLGKYVGMKFEGMTEQPENLTVLSAVTASTGDSIEFEYGEYLDESIDQNHSVLEKVIYRDADNAVTDEASLSWTTSQEGTSPSIRRAIEPRSTRDTPDIAFDYYPGNLAVKGQPSFILAGDPAASRIIQVSDPKKTAKYIAPDGGSHTIVNTNTSAYRPSSTTDAGGKTTSYAWSGSGYLNTKTDPSGATTYTRNSRGQILTVTRPDGLTTTHTYFATRLLTVTHSAPGLPSRTTTYTRDGTGRVTKITYPDASYEDYTYNSHGLLTAVREKNGTFTVHTYHTTANSSTAGLRLATTHGITAANAAAAISAVASNPALGETTSYTYHLPGNTSGSPARLLATITDPRNRSTSYQYDHAGRITKTTYPDNSIRQIERDDFGNKIAEFDGSTVQEWTYDFFRRVLTHTVDSDPEGLNLTTTYDYGLNGSSCSCYGSGGPTLITSPASRKTRRTYDLMGRLLTETHGFLTADAATTARQYDTLGRMTKLTDPDGYNTTYSHDSMGRVLVTSQAPFGFNFQTIRTYSSFGDTLTTTLPGGRTTTIVYDKMSRPVSIKDPLNLETIIVYDLGGRRTDVIEAFGTASVRTTEFDYNEFDRLTTTTYPDTTTVSQTYHLGGDPDTTTDERGHSTTNDTALVTWTDSESQTWTSFARTTTDAANLTTTTYGPPMSFTGGTRRTVTPAGRISEAYIDPAGRTTLVSNGLVTSTSGLTADVTDTVMTHDDDGFMLTSTTDPSGLNLTTTYTPDGLARVKTVTDPLNRTTTYFYDKRGNRVKTKLPDNREHLATYDTIGRLNSTTDPKNQKITHTYWYETGQTLTLKDARNHITTWTYNLRGQILTKLYPNGDDHAYTYDTLGRMETHTTPNNHTCTYGYDLRDRQLNADWDTSTPDTARTYWENGLLKTVDNGVSKSEYFYNNRNLLTSEIQTLASRPARTVGYDHDADGLRSDLNYPSTLAIDYTWTARAQLHTVVADTPPPLATYTYDKAGRNTALVHENGITQGKTWDTASQLEAINHLKGGTPVSGHGYTLDSTGRRTNETFADGSTPARGYGYDDADQVTSATYGSGQSDSYNYDAMGNRTTASIASEGGTSINYGTANNVNQYTSITGLTPISHDANGNLLQQNNVTYTWDSENRLLSVAPTTPALGDKSLVHTYDGQQRRVTRTLREWTTSGWDTLETTHFIYDGWNVIEEYHLNTLNSVLVRTLTWGQDLGGSASLQAAGGVGGLIMVEEINGSTTNAYHFHFDGNGNVTEITDSDGDPAATYRYDAFGNTLVEAGPYAEQNRYRFSTKPLDGEVTNAPLYYYGYRYYDPLTGRWPSRDPIEEGGGMNLYVFLNNTPFSSIDYLGRHPIVIPVAGGVVVVGAAQAAAASFGLSVVACLAHPPCAKAMRDAIINEVDGLGIMVKDALFWYCKALYKSYKNLEKTCGACNPKRARCLIDRLTRCVTSGASEICWSSVLALRSTYIISGCDFVVEKENFQSHVDDLTRIGITMGKCALSIKNNCPL